MHVSFVFFPPLLYASKRMPSEQVILEIIKTLSSGPTWVGTYFRDIPLLSSHTKKPPKKFQKNQKNKKAIIIKL
jgi:hypothetical protein